MVVVEATLGGGMMMMMMMIRFRFLPKSRHLDWLIRGGLQLRGLGWYSLMKILLVGE